MLIVLTAEVVPTPFALEDFFFCLYKLGDIFYVKIGKETYTFAFVPNAIILFRYFAYSRLSYGIKTNDDRESALRHLFIPM